MFKLGTKKSILVIGMPKTGTSILAYWLKDSLPFCSIHFEPNGRDGLTDFKLHHSITQKRRVITKSLYYNTTNDISNIINLYQRVIWVIRDPRDQVISSFFYKWYRKHKNISEHAFKEALEQTLIKEKNPRSIPFHYLYGKDEDSSTNHAKYERQKLNSIIGQVAKYEKLSNFNFVKYEDLIAGNTSVIDSFLGFKLKTHRSLPQKLKRVERKKVSGSWRNWFCEEDIDFYKPIYIDYLNYFGYNADDWQLHLPTSLSAEEGSNYMKKLFSPD